MLGEKRSTIQQDPCAQRICAQHAHSTVQMRTTQCRCAQHCADAHNTMQMRTTQCRCAQQKATRTTQCRCAQHSAAKPPNLLQSNNAFKHSWPSQASKPSLPSQTSKSGLPSLQAIRLFQLGTPATAPPRRSVHAIHSKEGKTNSVDWACGALASTDQTAFCQPLRKKIRNRALRSTEAKAFCRITMQKLWPCVNDI